VAREREQGHAGVQDGAGVVSATAGVVLGSDSRRRAPFFTALGNRADAS
jgi:hypothetical protein